MIDGLLQTGDEVEVINIRHPRFGQRGTIVSFVGSVPRLCVKTDNGEDYFYIPVDEIKAVVATTPAQPPLSQTADFIVKDSGKREEFSGGMVRDTAADKVDYSLVFDGPMFERFAKHLTLGAKKYNPRNWMKAAGEQERERFRQSAVRHFFQWLRGDTDEDHASAVFFNINGHEYVKSKLEAPQ